MRYYRDQKDKLEMLVSLEDGGVVKRVSEEAFIVTDEKKLPSCFRMEHKISGKIRVRCPAKAFA